MDFDFASFPWLLIIVALGPILLFLPLLAELLRRRDVGPRPLPSASDEANVDAPFTGDLANPGPSLLRIDGNLHSSGRAFLNHLIVHGHISLPPGVTVEGTIKATEYVELGEGAVVKGDIIAGGNVSLGVKASVEGIIDSGGAVTLLRGAAARAVIAKGGTTLVSGAEVGTRVVSGGPIRTEPAEFTSGIPVEAPPPPPAISHEVDGAASLAEIEQLERSLEGLQAPLHAPTSLPPELALEQVYQPEELVGAEGGPTGEAPRTPEVTAAEAPGESGAGRLLSGFSMPRPRRRLSGPSVLRPTSNGSVIMKFPGGLRRVPRKA